MFKNTWLAIKTLPNWLKWCNLGYACIFPLCVYMGKLNPWELILWTVLITFADLWAVYVEQTVYHKQKIQEDTLAILKKLSKKKGYKRQAKSALKMVEEVKAEQQENA
jgi:hypothetical protein